MCIQEVNVQFSRISPLLGEGESASAGAGAGAKSCRFQIFLNSEVIINRSLHALGAYEMLC